MARARGIWTLVLGHAAADFYTGAIAALLPYFVLEQRYDYAAVAGITLAGTALSGFVQPWFGALADRYRMRWLIVAGLLIAGGGVAVSGLLAGSYWLAWLAIALSGIGTAAFHPPATLAARSAAGGGNVAMGVFSVGGNIGGALAPSAVVATVGILGLGATPLLMIPAAVVAVLYLIAGRRAGTVPVGPEFESAMTGRVADSWRSFAWLVVVLATWSVGFVATSGFVALYQIERFGVSEAVAAIALSLFPAAGAVGTLAGGWLADRFGRLRMMKVGFAAAAVSAMAIVLAPNPAVVVVATVALGLGLFVPFASMLTLAHSYLPNRIALASGLTFGLTLSLGGLVNPLLGVLADASGVGSVFALMAVLLALGFAVVFVLRERTAPPTGISTAATDDEPV